MTIMTILLALAALAASVTLTGKWLRSTVRRRRLGSGLPSRTTFRGRQRELDALRAHFDMLNGEGKANGAIIIAIHGMPGVGKSALAQEFAQQLATLYPGGQLYANLGSAGRIRAEADILSGFLAALRPGEPVPRSTSERSARFRSLTANMRVLVILDAARDREQVARLLPTGEECAVIVTSRRDLGPALGVRSFLLDVPATDDALDILHTLSHTPPDEHQKFALEIIDRVGRLPMAIRAVGDEVLRTADSLRPAARRLRDPELLGPQGKFVEDRIESEYGRLTSDEARAYRLASLSDAPSFAPWILVPLLELDLVEVEKIVSRLAVQQLLQPAGVDLATALVTSEPTGVDVVTGLDRYRFHPVFRSFAERECKRDEQKQELAILRMTDAYLELIDRVLTKIDPTYRQSLPRSEVWADLPILVTEPLDRWVRAEYLNLLRCVEAAYAYRLDEMCWRIAAWLGGSVPRRLSRRVILDRLERGYDSARRLGDRRGMAAVQLAKGSFLGRLSGHTEAGPEDGRDGHAEGHAEAFAALAEAAHLGNRMWAAPPSRAGCEPSLEVREGARIQSEAHRRTAEVHLNAGARRDAMRELDRAARLAELYTDRRQIALVALMRAAAGDESEPLCWEPAWELDDELVYWHRWALAERACGQQRWRDASDQLHLLRQRFDDDGSRVSAILLRLAELRLEQFHLDPENKADWSRNRAVHRAAEAVYRFQNLHHKLGIARARCQFARGLLAMGRLPEAKAQYELAVEETLTLEPLVSHQLSPLQAVLKQTEGELLRAEGHSDSGDQALVRAACLYRLHGDRMGEMIALATGGLEHLPADAFDPGPPGREPRAWLEGLEGEDAPLIVGGPFDICFTIGPPKLTEELPPAGGRILEVVVVTDDAEVVPAAITTRLDAWAGLDPLRFRMTPGRTGPLHVQILVYSAGDGSLLQKAELEPLHVTDAA